MEYLTWCWITIYIYSWSNKEEGLHTRHKFPSLHPPRGNTVERMQVEQTLQLVPPLLLCIPIIYYSVCCKYSLFWVTCGIILSLLLLLILSWTVTGILCLSLSQNEMASQLGWMGGGVGGELDICGPVYMALVLLGKSQAAGVVVCRPPPTRHDGRRIKWEINWIISWQRRWWDQKTRSRRSDETLSPVCIINLPDYAKWCCRGI